MGRISFSGKRQAEVVIVPFDFTSSLGATETIVSAQVTATVWTGVDPNPQIVGNYAAVVVVGTESGYGLTTESGNSIILQSSGAVTGLTPTISGAIVNQFVSGGVLGTIYELQCLAVTSLGQTLELAGYFAIIPDLP